MVIYLVLVPSAQARVAVNIPTNVRVVAADRANVVSWQMTGASRAVSKRGFLVYRSYSKQGPWVLLSRIPVRRLSLIDKSAERRTTYYRVRALPLRGTYSPLTSPVANSLVDMSRWVGPEGGSLEAANGEVTLSLAPGAFAASTRVRLTETGSAPELAADKMSVASNYLITPEGPLASSATLTIRYEIPANSPTVRAALAPYARMVTYDSALGTWSPVLTTVDTPTATFTGYLTHFSYWTGEIVQPHGVPASVANYCQSVCHPISPSGEVQVSRDKSVCYNCHGNYSAGPPAGTVRARVPGPPATSRPADLR